MTFKALLIGCGNIGALYDIENSFIQTHAKAISLSNWINEIDVFDLNEELSTLIANRYNFNKIVNIDYKKLNIYSLVCICTPTLTHFKYLKACIISKVPLIICEKPISEDLNELNILKNIYNKGNSKVLVNYCRRFQKKYQNIKNEITTLRSEIININIKYHKGFLNNASHALDLINFLFDIKLEFSNLIIESKKNDYFKNDPTLSFSGFIENIKLELVGIYTSKSLLEVEILFKNHKAIFSNRGNDFFLFKKNKLVKHYDSLLVNYMKDVLEEANLLYCEKNKSDNFINSLNLNKQLINIL